MGLPAKKDDDQQHADSVELPSDREQGLSKNFADPSLEEYIPGLVDASPRSVTEEAVEAIQELVSDLEPQTPGTGTPTTGSIVDLTGDFATPGLSLVAPAVPAEELQNFMLDGHATESGQEAALWAMAEKLFELVVCERSFDDLAESALVAMMAAVRAQAGSLLEFDQDRQDFFFRANLGGASPPETLKAFRVPVGKGIVGHVAESKQALLLRDLENDQLQMRAISASVGFEAKTCMAAPILVGGQLYGVIEFFNKSDGTLFEEQDMRVLECGVRMIAKVLEVRFLMAEMLRRMR